MIDNERDRQKERAKRDWHTYVWGNRWTDRQTDRQMVASIWENLAFMGWTNGPADRHTECQKFCWDALNGQIEKKRRLDILMLKLGCDAQGQVKKGRGISEDHQHEEGLNFKVCLEIGVTAITAVCECVCGGALVVCIGDFSARVSTRMCVSVPWPLPMY